MKKIFFGIISFCFIAGTVYSQDVDDQLKGDVILKAKTLQEIVNYLATKPYMETAKLISDAVKVRPYIEPKTETEKETHKNDNDNASK